MTGQDGKTLDYVFSEDLPPCLKNEPSLTVFFLVWGYVLVPELQELSSSQQSSSFQIPGQGGYVGFGL